jgi:hypothetical protein
MSESTHLASSSIAWLAVASDLCSKLKSQDQFDDLTGEKAKTITNLIKGANEEGMNFTHQDLEDAYNVLAGAVEHMCEDSSNSVGQMPIWLVRPVTEDEFFGAMTQFKEEYTKYQKFLKDRGSRATNLDEGV